MSGCYRRLRSNYLTGSTCTRLVESFDVRAQSNGISVQKLDPRLRSFVSMCSKFGRMSRICYTQCYGAANVSEFIGDLYCRCAALFDSS